MDITWYGQSCFKIKGKNATIVTDPYYSEDTGLKKLKLEADLVTISHEHQDHNNREIVGGTPFVLDAPGEYEIKGVAVHGIKTFHDNNEGKDRGLNTMFTFEIDGIVVCHCGDLGHVLSPAVLEYIDQVDILLIPVGGEYTVDARTALEVVNQLAPKVVIPMHYKVEGLTIELDPLEKFISAYGKGMPELQTKYSIAKDKLPEDEELVVLSI